MFLFALLQLSLVQPIVIANASVSLVVLISNEIVKMFLKTMGKLKNKHIKIALLARSKLNGIEKIISKAMIDSDISHKEFTLVINLRKNYFRLKERIKGKDNHLGATGQHR